MSDNGLYVTLWCILLMGLFYFWHVRFKKFKQQQNSMLKHQKMLAQTMALKRAKKSASTGEKITDKDYI